VNIEFDDSNDRMYMFVPWLHFAEGDKNYVLINTDHVMASSKPTDYLIDQYKIAVFETNEFSRKRVEDHAKRKEEGLQKLEQAIRNKIEEEDYDNVVRFPGSDKETIH
jgi:lantibiotic modifying enzyme